VVLVDVEVAVGVDGEVDAYIPLRRANW